MGGGEREKEKKQKGAERIKQKGIKGGREEKDCAVVHLHKRVEGKVRRGDKGLDRKHEAISGSEAAWKPPGAAKSICLHGSWIIS